MEYKSIISGAVYTIYFNSDNQRTKFTKEVEIIYKIMSKNPKFENKTALRASISIAIAENLKIKIEKHF